MRGVLQKYQRTGRIVFISGDVKKVPSNFLIHTEFVDHYNLRKFAKEGVVHYRHPLTINEIKTILDDCAELIVQKEVVKTDDWFDSVEQEEVREPSLLDIIIEIDELLEGEEMDTIELFAKLFGEKAKVDEEGLVSDFVLGQIRKNLGMKETPKTLVTQGWLEGFAREGKKKIGWYRATDQLLERLSLAEEKVPTDEFRKAQWLLDNEEVLEAEIAEHQRAIEQLEKLVAAAKKVSAFKEEMAELCLPDESFKKENDDES